MSKHRQIPRLATLAMPLLLAAVAQARAGDVASEPQDVLAGVERPAYALQLDNDLFGAGSSDRDYSWGATVTFGSAETGRATQVGIIAMTPDDLKATEPLPDDRPYASLVYATSSQLVVAESGDRSRFTSLTLGVLGTGLAESLQRAVHKVQNGIVPAGWDHQVSEGGEPTARFVIAEQWLVDDGETPSGALRQTKLTLSGSAGYLTEAGAAISMRWGRIDTPWWSFNPELGDYSSAPVAPTNGYGFNASQEMYGFVGARVKARAYNALLQGQFRHSDVRVASDDVARFQAEVWAGVATVLWDWQLIYSLHAASREITIEPADRTMVWASLSFVRAF
jgi:hypothetical protein